MNYLYLLIPLAIIILSGIRIVQNKQRGLIERLGKYKKYVRPGFHWIIPLIDKLHKVDVAEQVVDIEHQKIATYDDHFTNVNARVYFRVKTDEESIKGFIYNANNYKRHLFNLTRSSLRNIINTLTYSSANAGSKNINYELHKTLANETNDWGIEILDVDLQKYNLDQKIPENNLFLTSHFNTLLENYN
jgi:regulator of protease activity HflC (stomatin/prohibitin superfamily)